MLNFSRSMPALLLNSLTLCTLFGKCINKGGCHSDVSRSTEVLWQISPGLTQLHIVLSHIIYYHTSNSRECMGVNVKALQLQFIKSCLFTASHTRIRISHYKSRVLHPNVQWKLYKKMSLVCCRWHCYSCCVLVIIQTAANSCYYISITIVQSYTGKYHEFVAVCIVTSAQHE